MILAILQARMSSSRLPGKVLKQILGKPMLACQLERLQRIEHIDKLITATSNLESDIPIAELCARLGIPCYRGNLDDVLDRYYQAALPYRPDAIVRLTGDCPLIDPQVVDDGILYFLDHDYDYVTNAIERTHPVGLDFEVFRFRCLEAAWRDARLPSEREHVTPFIRNHPERFTVGHVKLDTDLSHHRWTVDEPEDFMLIKTVFENLYPENPRFTTSDILTFLAQRPELTDINYHITHGLGYEKSLREDARYLARRKTSAKTRPS